MPPPHTGTPSTAHRAALVALGQLGEPGAQLPVGPARRWEAASTGPTTLALRARSTSNTRMPRALVPTLFVLAACSPASLRVELPKAGADALVVGVALDTNGEPREVLGPFRLADVPSFELPGETKALAAFVLEPSQWLSTAGEPLTAEEWSGLRVLRPGDAGRPELCTSCAVPRDVAPALVAPGDRCALPPFVRGAVVVEGAEAPDPTWIERARAGLELAWSGTCGARWAPLAASRAVPESCGWAPAAEPVIVDQVAEADDGTLLGVSITGLMWVERAPGRPMRRGHLDLPGRQLASVVAVEGPGPRRWLITTRAAVGSGRAIVHLIEDTDAGYVVRPSGAGPDMAVGAVVRPLGERNLFAVGRESSSLSSRQTVRPCTLDGDTLECPRQMELIRDCIDANDATSGVVRAAGRVVSLTELGRVLARVDETSAWACAPPYDARYRDDTGAQRSIATLPAMIALGPWVYACGDAEAGSTLLRIRVPSSTIPLDRDALSRALRTDARSLPGSPCVGFATTATPGVALAWVGDRRVRVDDQGRVDVVAQREDVLGRVYVSPAGSTLRVVFDGRVYRSRAGGPEELVFGTEQRTPTLRALAATTSGFVGMDDSGDAWAIDVGDFGAACAALPRPEPQRVALDGGTTAFTRAWARDDAGVWWGWREPSSLVRVDVSAGRREVWPVEPPLDLSALVGTAAISPGELVVVTRSSIHRVSLQSGVAELSAPLTLDPWGNLRLIGESEWTDVGRAEGVVWVSGRDALARVTAVSAEATGVAGWAGQVAMGVQPTAPGQASFVVALAPDHVLVSTRDTVNRDSTRVLTYEVAPRSRGCARPLTEGAALGASLRVCLFPDGGDASIQTSLRYAPRLGAGPGSDPLLINAMGLVYRGPVAAEGLGLTDPLALAQDAGGVFVVSADDGQLIVGRRALRAAR